MPWSYRVPACIEHRVSAILQPLALQSPRFSRRLLELTSNVLRHMYWIVYLFLLWSYQSGRNIVDKEKSSHAGSSVIKIAEQVARLDLLVYMSAACLLLKLGGAAKSQIQSALPTACERKAELIWNCSWLAFEQIRRLKASPASFTQDPVRAAWFL